MEKLHHCSTKKTHFSLSERNKSKDISMKQIFIVANWKSNKTIVETKEWFQSISQLITHNSKLSTKTIILCPPSHLLELCFNLIKEYNLPIALGAQDVSPFDMGAYTGEIAAKQLKEYVTHCIIGHSERRRYFHETDEETMMKIKQLLANNITPVLCISDLKQLQHYVHEDSVLVTNAEKIIFVYEPPSAISGGGAYHAEEPEAIDKNAAEIEKMIGKTVVTIYGGSVNPDNAATIFQLSHISGGLPGQASLDPAAFASIITHA